LGNFRTHNLAKFSGLVLVLCLLFPSFVKFSHIFEHHQHEVCLGEHTTHLHKVDTDCDFYKFKLNNAFTFTTAHFEFAEQTIEAKKIESQYNFISAFQRLHFSLRGPPQLV